MRLLGRWSLASFMGFLVNFFYYSVLVLLVVVFLIVLWIALHGYSGSVQFNVPVRFQLDPQTHPFVTARHGIQSASITEAQGTLSVRASGSSLGIGWAGFGFLIVTLGVVLLVLSRLRAIFQTLKDQNPFLEANASRIQLIGAVLVLGELGSGGLAAWFSAQFTKEISVTGVNFEHNFAVNLWVIFAGLILLIIAEIFRLGAEMKGDVETARKIQLDLVPGEVFRKNNVEVQARMRPAKTVGGDYYDVLELDESHLGLIVGDVTGKGLPAAMLMASVLGSVRALSSTGLRGSELIAALNRNVCANPTGDRLVTLFYGELDTATGQMSFVNAGHNPPLLLHSDGSVDRLRSTAMVLGVKADAPVESQQVEIKPSDRLLLFTDGFSEAFNKRNEDYGEKRLAESFARVRTLPLKVVVERLVTDVLNFCGSVQPRDDMTLMVVARQSA